MLPRNPLGDFSLLGSQKDLGKVELLAIQGEPFNQAIQIATQQGAKAEWNVQIIASVNVAVKKGDVLFAHFWMRCSDSMTGEGLTTFVFESIEPPEFVKEGELRISANGPWKECSLPFKTRHDYAPGQAQIAFRAGFDRQTIEIGGIEMLNYGPEMKLESLPRTEVTYDGREPDAAWRKEALARIERIRKGDLKVQVVDASGAAIPGASVHVELRRHEFGFGTCVDTGWLLGKGADNDKYRQTILQLFPLVVFENDMKWQATWDGVPPKVDEAVRWLHDHDIAIRGHNLVWPSWQWLPHQLRAYQTDPSALREITARHITDIAAHFRGHVTDWDVVNEVYANHDLVDLLGGRSILLDWYKLAHEADPGARLFINDFGILEGTESNDHRQGYFDMIQYLLKNGAPLGGIGIQSHFATNMPSPMQVLQVLDQFAKFNLPIESTEASFNLQDRQVQADYLRDYTIAVFSHPAVHDMILWGFWSKRHWRPDAALFADDWSIRPLGQAWIDLTKRVWNTDVKLTTDKDGAAGTRAFYGRYDITVTAGTKHVTTSATFTAGSDPVLVRVF